MENSTVAAAEAAAPSMTFVKLCLLWTALHKGEMDIPTGCRNVLSEDDVLEIRMSPNDGIGNILDRLDDGSRYYNWWKERHSVRRQMDDGSNGGRGVTYHYNYTSRSLSVIGVLGGIVLLLLIVALSTCIKNRRNILLESPSAPSCGHNGQESFARQILIDHIRHLSQAQQRRDSSGGSSSNSSEGGGGGGGESSPPPSYHDAVVKAQRVRQEQQNCQASNGEGTSEMAASSELQPPSYMEALEREEAVAEARAGAAAATYAHYVVEIEVSSSVASEDGDGGDEGAGQRTSGPSEGASS